MIGLTLAAVAIFYGILLGLLAVEARAVQCSLQAAV